jgi:patatin-like phospholipase/acyl hydrolase
MTSYACLQTVVLGIHGGGYRGLLSAKILMEIERRTGKAIRSIDW